MPLIAMGEVSRVPLAEWGMAALCAKGVLYNKDDQPDSIGRNVRPGYGSRRLTVACSRRCRASGATRAVW